jgi:adenylate kinase family enzyme
MPRLIAVNGLPGVGRRKFAQSLQKIVSIAKPEARTSCVSIKMVVLWYISSQTDLPRRTVNLAKLAVEQNTPFADNLVVDACLSWIRNTKIENNDDILILSGFPFNTDQLAVCKEFRKKSFVFIDANSAFMQSVIERNPATWIAYENSIWPTFASIGSNNGDVVFVDYDRPLKENIKVTVKKILPEPHSSRLCRIIDTPDHPVHRELLGVS